MKVRVVSSFQTSHHDEANELVVQHHEVGDEIELERSDAIAEVHRNRVVALEPLEEAEPLETFARRLGTEIKARFGQPGIEAATPEAETEQEAEQPAAPAAELAPVAEPEVEHAAE